MLGDCGEGRDFLVEEDHVLGVERGCRVECKDALDNYEERGGFMKFDSETVERVVEIGPTVLQKCHGTVRDERKE